MVINIKRIIREEMQRIIEGDVVYPEFGGGPKPREESELQQVLKKVKDMLEEILNDEGQGMEDATVVVLNDLFDHVEELYDEASSEKAESEEDEEDDEEPFGGPATDRERSELKGFNTFMKDRDRKGDY